MPDSTFAVPLPEEAIRDLCRRHGVERLAVFGSVIGTTFDDSSDIDFLVRFRSEAEKPWMANFQELEEALRALLHRPVDLVDWKGIEQSENWVRRESILGSARPLYGA